MMRDMDPLLSRITIDPAVCHGKPCIRGLRYPVETLLELLSSGMTVDEILTDHEDLEREDLLAAMAYAAQVLRTQSLDEKEQHANRRVAMRNAVGRTQDGAGEQATPEPGSKEAVLRHFGVFRDDGDLEEQLAQLREQRKAAGN
jgi:uncharacterized protein (DUF433 family)